MRLSSFKFSLDYLRLYFFTVNPSLLEDSSTRLQTNLSISPFCDSVNSNTRFFLSFFSLQDACFCGSNYDQMMNQNK